MKRVVFVLLCLVVLSGQTCAPSEPTIKTSDLHSDIAEGIYTGLGSALAILKVSGSVVNQQQLDSPVQYIFGPDGFPIDDTTGKPCEIGTKTTLNYAGSSAQLVVAGITSVSNGIQIRYDCTFTYSVNSYTTFVMKGSETDTLTIVDDNTLNCLVSLSVGGVLPDGSHASMTMYGGCPLVK